jgi:hypothetical protein
MTVGALGNSITNWPEDGHRYYIEGLVLQHCVDVPHQQTAPRKLHKLETKTRMKPIIFPLLVQFNKHNT